MTGYLIDDARIMARVSGPFLFWRMVPSSSRNVRKACRPFRLHRVYTVIYTRHYPFIIKVLKKNFLNLCSDVDPTTNSIRFNKYPSLFVAYVVLWGEGRRGLHHYTYRTTSPLKSLLYNRNNDVKVRV
ncbi:hypothetical protein SAMN05444358_1011705 [Ruegeria halocynthiae]|uniref:Uncharacterized protein n=1 Tax=Ruegeria halocynthiae TaxID=985054 RepID=A0A1H2W8A7_9RHOB|nr:hypothetical protein SAMN05444358_1011705 [Ruegeria halocynthiae]